MNIPYYVTSLIQVQQCKGHRTDSVQAGGVGQRVITSACAFQSVYPAAPDMEATIRLLMRLSNDHANHTD